MRVLAFVFALALISAPVFAQQPAKRLLTFDDFARFKSVADSST